MRSSVESLVYVLRHWVDFSVQLSLYLYHVLLVFLGYQVYCQANLSESSASTDSMQVNVGLRREIEVDDHVDCLYIDSSSYEIGTHQSFELSFPEPLKNIDSLLPLHVRMQIFVLILLLIQLLW